MNTLISRKREKPDTNQFGMVFRCCTDDPLIKGLKNLPFRVYIMLLVCAGGSRTGVTISTDKLAERTGLARSTFFRGLKVLKEKGLVEVKRFGTINGEKTGANTWFIYNPPGVTPYLSGSPFGLNSGTTHKFKSDEVRPTRPDEGSPRNGTHSGVTGVTGYSCKNKSEILSSDTERLKTLEALTGFLGKQVEELATRLENMDEEEASCILFNDWSAIHYFFEGGHEWIEHLLKEDRKALLYDSLRFFDCNLFGTGYDYILSKAIKEFSPTNQERSGFLTECQRIVSDMHVSIE